MNGLPEAPGSSPGSRGERPLRSSRLFSHLAASSPVLVLCGFFHPHGEKQEVEAPDEVVNAKELCVSVVNISLSTHTVQISMLRLKWVGPSEARGP